VHNQKLSYQWSTPLHKLKHRRHNWINTIQWLDFSNYPVNETLKHVWDLSLSYGVVEASAVVWRRLAADNKCRSFVTNDCLCRPTNRTEYTDNSKISFFTYLASLVFQFVAATHISEFEGNNLLISSGLSEILRKTNAQGVYRYQKKRWVFTYRFSSLDR
jgi:hypothetical protein